MSSKNSEVSENLPNIGHGGVLAGNDVLERKAREYAKEVVEETDIKVDLTCVTWRFSHRMTRTRGRCDYKENGRCFVVLSKIEYDNLGWDETAETIRHELIHVAQCQNGEPTGHGDSFRKRMDMMDIDEITAESPSKDYKYEVICPNCGVIGGRLRHSKVVKRNADYLNCRKCGSQNLEVERT